VKVLIVQSQGLGDLPSGEITVITQEKATLLELGHQVDTFIYSPENTNKKGLMSIFAKMKIAYSILWSFSSYKQLKQLIETHKPDVVHFHTIMPFLSLSVLKAARRKGVPIIQTLHNFRWLCVEGGFYRHGMYCNRCTGNTGWNGVRFRCSRGLQASVLLFLVNVVARKSGFLVSSVSKFIAVSDYVKREYVQSGFPESKLVVKNNALPEMGSRFQVHNKSQRTGIAFVGRISTAKGIQVIRYLISRIEQPVHIVGNGPELDQLERFCEQGSYSHVKLWSKQSHEAVLNILSGVCCSVIPSQCGETFSLVASESLALGTPIVGSNIGGVKSMIDRSDGGITVDPRDYDGFLGAVKMFLSSPEKVVEYGERGRYFVNKELPKEKLAVQLENIYLEAIRENEEKKC